MTAIRQRRSRSTWVGLVAAVIGLVGAAVLGLVGVQTLADSTSGRAADGPTDLPPSQRLPFTATSLIGTLDEDGRLTSVVVGVLEPDGTGGTLIQLAAGADVTSGNGEVLAPLDAMFAVDGPDALRTAVEVVTGLSFDVIELVDGERFAQLVTPLGDLPVRLPVDIRDASSEEEWAAGELSLSASGASRVLSATDPSIADWYFEPARAAVWAGVAGRVGAGIGSAEPVGSDQELTAPATLDEFVDRLFAGPVEHRALTFRRLDAERVDDELDPAYADEFGPDDVVAVVVHDRAEILMVAGAVAPTRVGAPLSGPTFRIVSPFGSDDLDEVDLTSADVLRQAIDRLLFVSANAVSVADDPDEETPDVTRVRVADPAVVGAVAESYQAIFGEIDVAAAEVVVEGIDVEVTLGRTFLDELDDGGSPSTNTVDDDTGDVAGSGDDD